MLKYKNYRKFYHLLLFKLELKDLRVRDKDGIRKEQRKQLILKDITKKWL